MVDAVVFAEVKLLDRLSRECRAWGQRSLRQPDGVGLQSAQVQGTIVAHCQFLERLQDLEILESSPEQEDIPSLEFCIRIGHEKLFVGPQDARNRQAERIGQPGFREQLTGEQRFFRDSDALNPACHLVLGNQVFCQTLSGSLQRSCPPPVRQVARFSSQPAGDPPEQESLRRNPVRCTRSPRRDREYVQVTSPAQVCLSNRLPDQRRTFCQLQLRQLDGGICNPLKSPIVSTQAPGASMRAGLRTSPGFLRQPSRLPL